MELVSASPMGFGTGQLAGRSEVPLCIREGLICISLRRQTLCSCLEPMHGAGLLAGMLQWWDQAWELPCRAGRLASAWF